MRENHAPMSLLNTCRSGGFIKRTVPFLEHMHCSTFLFCHHKLQRDASILDVEDPLVSHKLRLLCHKRLHSMFDSTIYHFRRKSVHWKLWNSQRPASQIGKMDSPVHYLQWYYLHNKNCRTIKGFQVKSGYDTCLQRLPNSTTPSVLWSRTATAVQSREIFNLIVRENHVLMSLRSWNLFVKTFSFLEHKPLSCWSKLMSMQSF